MEKVGVEPTKLCVQSSAPTRRHPLVRLLVLSAAVMMGIEPTSTSIDNAPASPDAYTTLTNFMG